MTDKDTGGPAFPGALDRQHSEGMTLRDYFAAKAMQGLLSNPKRQEHILKQGGAFGGWKGLHMTDKELMQQALNALEGADQIDTDIRDAVIALTARLAEKQLAADTFEPDWVDYQQGLKDGAKAEREWVGLTDDEIKGIIGPWGGAPIKGYTRTLFDQIEAKLKEKNT